MNFLRTGKMWTVVLFFSISLMIISVCPPVGAAEGNKAAFVAPDFDLQDLSGSHVTLSQFKGQKPVLIEFWATWCHFCQAVRADVIKLRKDIPDSDIAILAINVGSGDSLAKVKRFEEANPAPYTVLYDPGSKVTLSYQVEGIPYFVLLDKTGEVKYQGSELPSNPMDLLK